MQFKSSFELRDVCGEHVLIATGVENINFNSLINLNETAAAIYQAFVHREFELSDVFDFVEQNYEGASRAQIESDVTALFDNFRTSGIIE
ncbi:MAG: PqqD family protein [Bacteroidales bacterium]|nr:PqqD family protein [Bacteroidales bacterium]